MLVYYLMNIRKMPSWGISSFGTYINPDLITSDRKNKSLTVQKTNKLVMWFQTLNRQIFYYFIGFQNFNYISNLNIMLL